MKLKIGMLLICLFTVAGLALAQAKVDGKWTAEVPGRGGNPQMVTFNFKTEGGKVTGTYMGGGRGGEVALEDVSLSGNMLTFKRKQMGRQGETIINYTGTVSGDE